tara:strand:+ start:46 stop:597 length:552 start_codon:yes stop_codon:yes gene_type:complete
MNIPSYTENNFAFGPGILKIGAAGSTPTTDVGAITEDGISIEITSEKRDISQGNPKLPVYTFTQAQGVNISVTGIEWNFENFAHALGSGVQATSVGVSDIFEFGGDPLVTQVAIQVEHIMAVTGDTLNVNVWKAVSNGGLTLPFTADEHQFEYSWKALRSATDWAGSSLDYNKQLVQIFRDLS